MKLQPKFIHFQENAFENVAWKMAVILSRPQCAKVPWDFVGHFGLRYLVDKSNSWRNFIENMCIIVVITVPVSSLAPLGATWWRHQMETFSALLAICAGNSPVPGEFPTQRPVTRSFDIFLICVWINGWVNNRETGDLRRHRAHYDITVI